MKTPRPLDAVNQLVDALQKGDLEKALSLYEPDASLVIEPSKVASGRSALRAALAGFIALKPVFTTEAYQIVDAGDIALYCSRWRLRGTDPAGHPVEMDGLSADVLRRKPDGNWLIALDNPWGTNIVA